MEAIDSIARGVSIGEDLRGVVVAVEDARDGLDVAGGLDLGHQDELRPMRPGPQGQQVQGPVRGGGCVDPHSRGDGVRCGEEPGGLLPGGGPVGRCHGVLQVGHAHVRAAVDGLGEALGARGRGQHPGAAQESVIHVLSSPRLARGGGLWGRRVGPGRGRRRGSGPPGPRPPGVARARRTPPAGRRPRGVRPPGPAA